MLVGRKYRINESFGSPEEINPYMKAGEEGLRFLSQWLGGAEGRKQNRWKFGQQKWLNDYIRDNLLNKDVVGSTQIAGIKASANEAMQPQFANLNWRSGRNAQGPQATGAFARASMPIKAGISTDIDQWGINTNIQQNQFLLRALQNLAR